MIDSARINQLTRQLLARSDASGISATGSEASDARATPSGATNETGTGWRSLLDSLQSPGPHYRQLLAYRARCLADSCQGDSLAPELARETLNTYRWLNRFAAPMRVLINIPSATLRVVDQRCNTLFSGRVVVGKRTTPTPLFTATPVVYGHHSQRGGVSVLERAPLDYDLRAVAQNPAKSTRHIGGDELASN